MTLNVTRIYCDGAVQKPGDAASLAKTKPKSAIGIVILRSDGSRTEISRRIPFQETNNTELQACLIALQSLETQDPYSFIYTDSEACVTKLNRIPKKTKRPPKQTPVQQCLNLMEKKKVGVVHILRSKSIHTSRANNLARAALHGKIPVTENIHRESFLAALEDVGKTINDLGLIVDIAQELE